MTEPQWTNKSEGVLCLEGASVEVRHGDDQYFHVWALGAERFKMLDTLAGAKDVGERIAAELREMGIKEPS